MTRGAIIVGGSSGIGEALARKLAADGYEIGLAARRTERMREIGASLPTQAYVATLDLRDTADARRGFFQLADAMPSVDVVVLSAGIGHENPALEWGPECETIDVNVRGFAALATAAVEYFEANPVCASDVDGHLVGISSVASAFGNGAAPAYNASKAFVSTYLEGLRHRQAGRKTDVAVTTVEPGFVDTEMAMGENLFWMCSPETAARQIARAIRKRKRHVYVTRRWRLVSWLLRATPEPLLRRLFA
ncbi:SDR family NAD(P)-dependent oxidoreductase [Salinilacihabitans rarus]|uniref:SDR family NAD(P)-dependent oxidoreductase n=1 Tax=Salinilacihabitans rarus TaxID=2961596 RepID=UPI0020C87A7C|nr:SDR family NAD(P)-dependent oxidoreductase [Salinilacihabitans rarus]